MDKLPWFPFYGRDFFGDETVKLFSLRQIGLYLALLWHQWEHGSIPCMEECQRFPLIATGFLDELQETGAVVEIGNELETVHYSCFKQCPDSQDRFYNPRLETIRQEQLRRNSIYQERARKGGLAKSMLQAGDKHGSSTDQAVLNSAIQNQIQKKNKKKKEKSVPLRADDDQSWIEDLKKNPAYQHINFAVEFGKMDAWFSLPKNKHRKRTQSFVLNWLNKIEAPMKPQEANSYRPTKVVL